MLKRWLLSCMAAACLTVVAGCDFGSESSHDDDDGGSAAAFQIGGTVSGLDGSVTLSAGDQETTVSANGDFHFADTYAEGTAVTLAVTAQPDGQTCEITSATALTVTADVTDVTVECTDDAAANTGSVTGTVINYHTGEPIEGATVTLSVPSGSGTRTVGTATSDASGGYSFDDTGISSRFVVSASADGFSTDSQTAGNSSDAPEAVAPSLQLLAAQTTREFDPTTAATITVDGATVVQLPAGALVDANGNAATNPVTATVTVLDPSSDTDVMPGGLQTLNADGNVQQIESWGALDVRFTAADGTALNLADGQTATLSIPVAAVAVAGAPATIPLYYFDEATGYWVEEGSASLTAVNGASYYVGTVTHFTTWNADRVYETVQITGCVADQTGNRLANVRITTEGQDYLGSASALSAADGTFSVPARTNSSVLLVALQSGLSQTTTQITSTVDLALGTPCLALAQSAANITLTWGENPRDLDSHFYGPKEDGTEFEVYFGHKSEIVDGTVFALDVDDVTSFGPEVVTALDFPLAGTYRYVVHLYAGDSTIQASPARVELNLAGATTIFSPAGATGDPADRYWHVFNLVVAEDGTVTVVPVQKFTDDEVLPNSVNNRVSAQSVRTQPRKYYAQ